MGAGCAKCIDGFIGDPYGKYGIILPCTDSGCACNKTGTKHCNDNEYCKWHLIRFILYNYKYETSQTNFLWSKNA